MIYLPAKILCTITVILILLAPMVSAAPPKDVMLVLDNSGSMRKNDPNFLARGAVESFINKLDTDSRAGVLIFDHGVTQAVALTPVDAEGRAALIKSLENINYRGQLTDSPAAVERAIYELKTNARDGADKFIVFMTDGIVDTGKPAVDVEKTKWLREELAVDAADNGIKVFAIAFTEHADFFLIQSLAKKTNGEYYRALTPADLTSVFDNVHDVLNAPPPAPPAPPVAVPAPPITPPPTAAPVITPLADDTVSAEPLGAPKTSDPGDLLASLPADERQALEEISEQTGIPIEQLVSELVGPDTGATAASPDTDGAIITYPEDEFTEAEQRMGFAILAASAAVLLLLVGLIVWFIMRRRSVSSASVGITAAPVDAPAIPEAFINDVHGYTSTPAIQLGEKPMMVGRVAGTDTDHLDYLVVNKGTIGRRHAVIKYKDFSFWIVDQGSVNGTFVNGERISGERQLKHGDQIRFHKYDFDYAQPDMDDGLHTIFADPDAADATIIASAGTLAATSVTELAANIDEQRGVAQATPAKVDGLGDADDMFGADANEAGESPSAAFADAPAFADTDDDVFDITGDTDMSAVDAGDETIDEDATAFFESSPMDATTPTQLSDDESLSDDEIDDDFDEDGEELGVEINLDAVGAGKNEDFDADASAFFEDITVGSTPDDDMFDISAAGAEDIDELSLDAKLDRATATLDRPDHDGKSTVDDDFADMDTVVPSKLGEPEDPNDRTLDGFIDTGSFESPATLPPADQPIAPSDDPGDVTLDAFMSTALFAAKVEVTNEDMTVLPAQVPDKPKNEDDDVVGDTVVLPNSPKKNKADDKGGPEDPTVVK